MTSTDAETLSVRATKTATPWQRSTLMITMNSSRSGQVRSWWTSDQWQCLIHTSVQRQTLDALIGHRVLSTAAAAAIVALHIAAYVTSIL